MPWPRRTHYVEAAALSVILLGGTIVRLWRPDLGRVQYDEAVAASLVAAWRFDGTFPLAGLISSTRLANPPGWPYILALGLGISSSPYALLAVGVATGILTLGLCWWITRRWLGAPAALAATAFYAGGFFPVFLGRTAWQPAFLPPLALLCLDALLTLSVRKRASALVVAAGWLGLMFQFHYVSAIHALMLPIAIWPARSVVRPAHLLSALCVAFAAIAPFQLYELHPQVSAADVRGLFASQGEPPKVDLAVLNYLWNLASNAGAIGLGAPSEAGLAPLLGRWTAAGLAGPLLVIAGVLCAVMWWPRGWRAALIVAWLLLPQVVLARHTLDVLLHYFIPELPVLAISVGCLAGGIAARARGHVGRLALTAVWLGIGSYVAASLGTLWVILHYADEADAHLGYGIPIHRNVEAATAVLSVLPPQARVLIGAQHYEGEILRFAIGYERDTRTFDDCQSVPFDPTAIYLLMSEHTPGAKLLEAAGSILLRRIPRPNEAYLIYSAPARSTVDVDVSSAPGYASRACMERRDADARLPTVEAPGP